MSLSNSSKSVFESTVKNFIRKMFPEQLELRCSDKKKLLEDLLTPIRIEVREQQRRVHSLYKAAKDAEGDMLAFNEKTRIEETVEFSIISSGDAELLELLDSILMSEQPDRVSIVNHSLFAPASSALNESEPSLLSASL